MLGTGRFQDDVDERGIYIYNRMLVDASEFKTWEDVFVKHGIPEIRGLQNDLQHQADAKRQELRSLIGERYKDLLETADRIDRMNEVSIKQENELVDMCGRGKYKVWDAGIENMSKYHNPKHSRQKLERSAVNSLFSSTILFLRKQLNDPKGKYICISRAFNLAELLQEHISSPVLELDKLKIKFNQILRDELLETSMDFAHGQSTSPVELFMAYLIFTRKSPDQVLEQFFEFRKSHISSILGRDDVASLVESLRLISTTLYITEQSFGKNQVHRMAVQHSQVYSLLNCSEFEGVFELNVDKYKSWLPQSVVQARSVPPSCTSPISNDGRYTSATKDAFSKKQADFGYSIIEMFSTRLPAIFGSIGSLGAMVQLYRELLELFRENSALRRLKGDNGLISTTIRTYWMDRFNVVLKQDALSLTDIKIASDETEEKSCNIFAADSVFATMPLNNDVETIDSIFSALKSFSVGNMFTIGQDIERWYNKVCIIKNVLEDVLRLRSYTSISWNNDITADEDDDDDAYDEQDEVWRIEEDREIINNYNAFNSSIQGHILEAYNSILSQVDQFFIASNDPKLSQVVFAIRSLRCLDYFMGHLEQEVNSQAKLLEGYQLVADQISLEHIQFSVQELEHSMDKSLWSKVVNEEENGDTATLSVVPTTPSVALSAKLNVLINSLCDILGHDELLWNYEPGVNVLRQKVLDVLATKLETFATEISSLGISDGKSKGDGKEEEDSSTDNQPESTSEISEGKGQEEGKEVEEGSSNDNQPDSTSEEQRPSLEQNEETSYTTTSLLLQVYTDYLYINNLLSRDTPKPYTHDIDFLIEQTLLPTTAKPALQNATSSAIDRTRLLYLPLAL